MLAVALDGADVKALRETMDKLKDKLKSAAIVLASVADGKVTLIAGVTSDLTAKVKAGELVNHVAQQVGGKGGGRPDMAQAGGTDPAGLPAALSVGARVRRAAAVSAAGPVALTPQFASDNYAGVCPEAWLRWRRRTPVTRRATAPTTGPRRRSDAIRGAVRDGLRRLLRVQRHGRQRAGIAAICRNTDAIVCHAMAHINVDECGAPEFFSGGAKLLTADTAHAKLTPDAVKALAVTPHDEHSSRPRALALTQATELGTLYSRQELERAVRDARTSAG